MGTPATTVAKFRDVSLISDAWGQPGAVQMPISMCLDYFIVPVAISAMPVGAQQDILHCNSITMRMQ